eukprot:3641813-Amphidinium_carterae.2
MALPAAFYMRSTGHPLLPLWCSRLHHLSQASAYVLMYHSATKCRVEIQVLALSQGRRSWRVTCSAW